MTIISNLIELGFLFCASGFFVSLKLLSSPKTARLGNALGAFSMLLAIFLSFVEIKFSSIFLIMIIIGFGALVGAVIAYKIKMTAMPQLVAVLNGLGGSASVLVALSDAMKIFHDATSFSLLFIITSWLSVIIGAITFTGSIVAYLKLEDIIPTRPMLFMGLRWVTVFVFLICLGFLFILLNGPKNMEAFVMVSIFSGILGILLVIPIGGADMPVVISLLNSYSGMAALAAGFLVKSNLLIISGSLVGASGIILTRLMCQAMNRSLFNVIFGAFGGIEIKHAHGEEKAMREFLPEDAVMLLANARKVILVPGYGLAVSQAQRNLKELADELRSRGIQIFYAIHPVAGRMPGHMNVLLAEADVSYDDLYDLDSINSEFETADVAIILGANDVVNPLARTDKDSPLFGMPILNADKAKTVLVLKRGKGRGFSGVENPLFTLDNVGLIFGDAKSSLIKILNALRKY